MVVSIISKRGIIGVSESFERIWYLCSFPTYIIFYYPFPVVIRELRYFKLSFSECYALTAL